MWKWKWRYVHAFLALTLDGSEYQLHMLATLPPREREYKPGLIPELTWVPWRREKFFTHVCNRNTIPQSLSV